MPPQLNLNQELKIQGLTVLHSTIQASKKKNISLWSKKKLKNDQATRVVFFLTRDLGHNSGCENYVISPKVLTQSLLNFHTL